MNQALKNLIIYSPAVSEALQADRPIVALESTVITHGLPYPRNFETLEYLENILIEQGVTPATIIVLGGKMHVGMTNMDKDYLQDLILSGDKDSLSKVSMRDLPLILAKGGNGGTTVSATMLISELAGIRFFATGGIGGVHRDWQANPDISMDIEALAHIPVTVISAGCKAILDVSATLETLESRGVPVWGWQTDVFPTFYSRTSNLRIDRVESEKELCAAMRIHFQLTAKPGGILIANPIPETDEIPADKIEPFILEAINEAGKRKITGKALTPFLLQRLFEITAGESVRANLALIENNVRLAGSLAKEYFGA